MNNSSKHCISLTVINASFNNRVERTQFLVNKFGKYLTGEILDVGCDQAPLKDIVKSIKYTGIDIDGKPTIKVDLERIDRLPFVDREFEVVVCCDVLEHIDNLHQIFGEIVRVAKRQSLYPFLIIGQTQGDLLKKEGEHLRFMVYPLKNHKTGINGFLD